MTLTASIHPEVYRRCATKGFPPGHRFGPWSFMKYFVNEKEATTHSSTSSIPLAPRFSSTIAAPSTSTPDSSSGNSSQNSFKSISSLMKKLDESEIEDWPSSISCLSLIEHPHSF